MWCFIKLWPLLWNFTIVFKRWMNLQHYEGGKHHIMKMYRNSVVNFIWNQYKYIYRKYAGRQMGRAFIQQASFLSEKILKRQRATWCFLQNVTFTFPPLIKSPLTIVKNFLSGKASLSVRDDSRHMSQSCRASGESGCWWEPAFLIICSACFAL